MQAVLLRVMFPFFPKRKGGEEGGQDGVESHWEWGGKGQKKEAGVNSSGCVGRLPSYPRFPPARERPA